MRSISSAFWSVSLFLLCATPALFSQQSQAVAFRDSGEVPFEMVKNAIVVPVTLHGVVYRFVLDTGGFLTVSEELRQKEGFPIVDSLTVSDANGAEMIFTRVKISQLQLGNLRFREREAIVTYDNQAYPNRCFGTDGMIGRDFFGGMLLHFDYQRGVIRLTEDRAVLSLTEDYRARMRISERGIPDVRLRVNGRSRFVEFDSGSGDLFSFKTKRAKRQRTKVLEFRGIFSFGVSSAERIEPDSRYRARVDALEIGTVTFSDFYSNFSKNTEPRIGASILYYGKVTVDYQKLGFYFEPYATSLAVPPLETFGFDLVYLKGEYLIKWVLAGSEAERQGLTFGLRVEAINGVPVAEVAQECGGYLNGYDFATKNEVQITYYTADGELRTLELTKLVYD
jgi:hypothetical protein